MSGCEFSTRSLYLDQRVVLRKLAATGLFDFDDSRVDQGTANAQGAICHAAHSGLPRVLLHGRAALVSLSRSTRSARGRTATAKSVERASFSAC